jgi:hypothetical protein
LAVLTIGLFSLPAFAQFTRDKAANGKIDEAINTHYLNMELDKAESVLTGTIQACEDKCSPGTLSRAWMYVGLVRGSGKNDQGGAAEAFETAKSIDPSVKLDTELATPETKATFEKIVGSAGVAAAPSAPAATASAETGGGEEAVPGDMVCSPEVREMETRRPLPISCATAEDAAAAELKFKAPGAPWKKIAMKKVGDAWQAEIPCAETGNAGVLEFYVTAKDGTGDDVDSAGSKKLPIQMQLAEGSTEAPPTFPGQAAPARCASAADCPPDFPGCDTGKKECGEKDWGASCDNSSECKCGLLCMSGSCETAPSCSSDSDCDEGSCVDGTCTAGGGGGDEEEGGELKHSWIGLHAAFDLIYQSAVEDACGPNSDTTSCYVGGVAFPLDNEVAVPLGTATGFAPGQLRLLLSYDYALSPNMTIGARAGYALFGAPEDFMPVHAEARFAYYFKGLNEKGFRPYVHIGGGMAEVNGHLKKTDVASQVTVPDPTSPTGFRDIPQISDVDIYTKAGTGFAEVGGGILWGTTRSLNLQLNVNAMAMIPTFGINIQPSLGLVYAL